MQIQQYIQDLIVHMQALCNLSLVSIDCKFILQVYA